MTPARPCPCGKSPDYTACCGRYLAKLAVPAHAEDLMRSRYTAFTNRDMDYLVATTDPRTRSNFDRAANRAWAESVLFVKLEVVTSREQGDTATVEFKAHFLHRGKTECHHERSRFRRDQGRWYFCEGEALG